MSKPRTQVATSLTAPFWDAARRGKLVRPVCSDCARSFFVPQIACPYCHSLSWTYQDSQGHGVIASFTIVHRAPTGAHQPPYVVALVDLEEGWSMMSNIVQSAPESVDFGRSVTVCFQKRDDGVVLPVFELRPIEPA